MIEFTRGVPPTESFPVDKLITCAKEALEQYGDLVLQYAKSYGFPPLREHLAAQLQVEPDRIIIGQGSLQLLDHLLRTHPAGSLTVAVEEPTYDRTVTSIQRAQAGLIPAAVTRAGLNLEKVTAALEAGKKLDYFYIIPDFQNPTGSVMTLEDREKLIAMARTFGFMIIEDSPYRLLRYEGDPLPSCFELAPDKVIQMSSYSKLICPGLRVGYMVLPDGFSARVAKVAEDTYINPSYLNQALVYQFIQKGWIDSQLVYLKDLYRQRRDAMLAALSREMKDLADWNEPHGGFFIACYVKGQGDADALMKMALENGVRLSDGRGFHLSGGEAFIRLPFCALNEEQIATGISYLARTIRSLMKE